MRFLPAGLLDMGWCGASKNVGKIKKACATRYITQQGPASLKIPTFSPYFRNYLKITRPEANNNFGKCWTRSPLRRRALPTRARRGPRLRRTQIFLSRGFLRKRFAPRRGWNKLSAKQS
jgi:hypothetical protein